MTQTERQQGTHQTGHRDMERTGYTPDRTHRESRVRTRLDRSGVTVAVAGLADTSAAGGVSTAVLSSAVSMGLQTTNQSINHGSANQSTVCQSSNSQISQSIIKQSISQQSLRISVNQSVNRQSPSLSINHQSNNAQFIDCRVVVCKLQSTHQLQVQHCQSCGTLDSSE